jgi:hypothetical protein
LVSQGLRKQTAMMMPYLVWFTGHVMYLVLSRNRSLIDDPSVGAG